MFRSLTSIFTSFFNQGKTRKVQPEIMAHSITKESKDCQSKSLLTISRSQHNESNEPSKSPLAYSETKQNFEVSQPSISRRDLIKYGVSGPAVFVAMQHTKELKIIVESKIINLKHLMSQSKSAFDDESILPTFASYKFSSFPLY